MNRVAFRHDESRCNSGNMACCDISSVSRSLFSAGLCQAESNKISRRGNIICWENIRFIFMCGDATQRMKNALTCCRSNGGQPHFLIPILHYWHICPSSWRTQVRFKKKKHVQLTLSVICQTIWTVWAGCRCAHGPNNHSLKSVIHNPGASVIWQRVSAPAHNIFLVAFMLFFVISSRNFHLLILG